MAEGLAIAALPDCLSVAVGEMCEDNGECGGVTHENISVCPRGRHILKRVLSQHCGQTPSPTESPFVDVNHHSLAPSFHETSSPKPSLYSTHAMDDTHIIDYKTSNDTPMDDHNSDPTVDSVGEYEAYPGMSNEKDDTGPGPGPGAWWTWTEANCSIELCAIPMLSLVLCHVISLILTIF